jgi:hypothetical protein
MLVEHDLQLPNSQFDIQTYSQVSCIINPTIDRLYHTCQHVMYIELYDEYFKYLV